jgi:hypothetical protein
MDSAAQLVFGIESVRSAIGRVATDWNAADLARLELARIHLESSLPPLKTALQGSSSVAPLRCAEIRGAAQSLKKEAAAIESLLDAAAAFLRSVSGVPENCSQDYTFSGEVRADSEAPAESYSG